MSSQQYDDTQAMQGRVAQILDAVRGCLDGIAHWGAKVHGGLERIAQVIESRPGLIEGD